MKLFCKGCICKECQKYQGECNFCTQCFLGINNLYACNDIEPIETLSKMKTIKTDNKGD